MMLIRKEKQLLGIGLNTGAQIRHRQFNKATSHAAI
jgi:hypothetical protein